MSSQQWFLPQVVFCKTTTIICTFWVILYRIGELADLYCYNYFYSPGGSVEEMESEEETVPMVTVAGEQVPYDEVTEEMVERLTATEKEEYIRVGQQIYEDMYS